MYFLKRKLISLWDKMMMSMLMRVKIFLRADTVYDVLGTISKHFANSFNSYNCPTDRKLGHTEIK